MGMVEISPSGNLAAYSVDFKGDETCGLYVKSLIDADDKDDDNDDKAADDDRDDKALMDHDGPLEVDGTVIWGSDDTTLFYLKMDEAHRPHQLYRRRIGKSSPKGSAAADNDADDELLFQEDDELFWVHAYKSFDSRYLFVTSGSKETSEKDLYAWTQNSSSSS